MSAVFKLVPLLVGVALSGCFCQPVMVVEDAGSSGGASSGLVGFDGGEENGDAGGTPDSGGHKTPVLSFVGSQPVTVLTGDSADLNFTLAESGGGPLANEIVAFALNNNGGTISISQTATGNNGGATVRFTAGNAQADVTLTATSPGAAAVNVAIQVRPRPVGTLTVNVSSQTRIAVTRAEIKLYTVPSNQTAPSCNTLLTASPLPNPVTSQNLTAVPASHSFTMVENGSRAAAYVLGYSAGGDLIGRGCADGAVVTGGSTTTISVVLSQLPTVLAGDYDVLMEIDAGNALPEPYDTYVDNLTLTLSNPAGAIVYYLLGAVDREWGTSFVWWTPPGGSTSRMATLEEVTNNPGTFGTWNTASNAANNGISGTSVGPAYNSFRATGSDIRGLVSRFEVGTHFTLQQANGNTYSVTESWRDVVYTWQRGCAQGDVGCARRSLQLANTRYAPVNQTYNALASYDPMTAAPTETERYKMLPDPHPMPFSYGAAVMIALTELVFPSVTGCSNCHSLSEVLNYLINCNSLGQTVWNSLGSLQSLVTPQQLAGYCISGVDEIGTEIEDQALMLTLGGPNPQLMTKDQPGISGGGVFFLVDADHNLKTELVRNLEMYVQWVTPNNPGQTQDVTAPIRGKGRTAATKCTTDSVCGANMSCQVIPHYLEIKALENTCQKNVGGTAGQQACANATDCRSGMCLGASSGVMGKCFLACTQTNQCAQGTSCDPARAQVDLNPTRSGLGNAPAQGCNP